MEVKELYEYSNDYFESLGFEESGQYEWVNKNGWTIEYLGTDIRPNLWRIDDFANEEGGQILFVDLVTKEDLEFLLKIVNVSLVE